VIRKTHPNEFHTTENLTREAFWNLFKPGCDEHLALHQLRKSRSYIEQLDFVALQEENIVGHIISTKAKVVDCHNNEYELLCVGPVSVLPEHQNNGIGSKLMSNSITEAKHLGFKGMVLFGNPKFYQRFGFINAKEYGIATKDNQNFDAFMALELQKNSLRDIKGKFFEDEGFFTQEDDLNRFETRFPAKEKGEPKFNIGQMK